MNIEKRYIVCRNIDGVLYGYSPNTEPQWVPDLMTAEYYPYMNIEFPGIAEWLRNKYTEFRDHADLCVVELKIKASIEVKVAV